nr:synaptobrevin, longin-like domain protein [Tanacetum cinerariifolium]
MAALKYKEEQNKVGYLLKPTESDDYHQIIDFLSESHMRESELGPPAILATIDKTPYTITEALVRSRLQLADDGDVVNLSIPKIYSGMDNLGYVTEGKLTFFKNKFSPQWRFLVHTLLHCLSTKSGSWDQFGSPIAIALICLSDGRRFNWSNYIFRGMVSNIKNVKKFLMYPRFLQTILGIETRVTRQYKVLAFSSKLFANMRLNFARHPMPLLPAMLLQAQAGGGAEVAEQVVPHPMPSSGHSLAYLPTLAKPPTSDPVASVLEHDHRSDQHESAAGSFPSREGAPLGGDFPPSPPRSSHAPAAGQPSGAELHDHKKLFKDVVEKLVKKVKSLEVKLKTKKRKMVVSDSDPEDNTTQDMDLDALRALANAAVAADSDIPSRNTSQVPAASSCAPTAGPSSTFEVPPALSAIPPGAFGVSPGPSVTLTAASAVPADSPKVPATVPVDSPNVPAGVSSKGKSPMVEEDIHVTARSFRQKEEDRLSEEAAKRLHEEEMAELEIERVEAQRKRQQEVLESAKFYNEDNWLNIRAQVEANASLSQTLLGDDERQNRPLTPAQQKAYMRQYVKNQSSAIYNTGWTMAYVKYFSDEQLLQEFKKIRKVQPQSQIQFSRTLKRPGPVLEEPSTKRPKSPEAHTPSMPEVYVSLSVTSPPSSRTRRKSLGLVVDEDSDDEDYVDEVWSTVVGWEVLSTPLGRINALYRIDGSTKHFTTLRQILHLVDRQDLMKLYGLVVQYYKHHPAAGAGLLFWGDLQVLFGSQAGGKGSCVWNNQSQWEIRSWRLYTLSNVHVLETISGAVLSMFTDVSYPLSVELMKKMLLHKLEIDSDFVGNDLTTAEVIVPTDSYIVPTGRVIVATGTYVVSADPDYSSKNHVRKFLRALALKRKAKVAAIKEAKILATLPFDELIGNLKVYETILGGDGFASKPIKEKVMPIALKANITRGQTSSNITCQDKSNEEEEINLMAKKFGKLFRKVVKKHDKFDICKEKTKGDGISRRECGCYNCGSKNHLIGNFSKPNRNKAFIGVAWSDSEDGDEPQNDVTVSWQLILKRYNLILLLLITAQTSLICKRKVRN